MASDNFLNSDTSVSTHLGFFAVDCARCSGYIGLFNTNPFTEQLHAAASSSGFNNRWREPTLLGGARRQPTTAVAGRRGCRPRPRWRAPRERSVRQLRLRSCPWAGRGKRRATPRTGAAVLPWHPGVTPILERTPGRDGDWWPSPARAARARDVSPRGRNRSAGSEIGKLSRGGART